MLSGRISRVEQKLEMLPDRMRDSTELAITQHCRLEQDRCPARSQFVTDVKARRG
jgi:hypothetical protein